MGLSIGKLAEIIGVSRRTVYEYEMGIARASVNSAYKLAEALGVAAKPINVLERTRKQQQYLLLKTSCTIACKRVLHEVFKKFASCDISPVHKAPFDFVMNVPDDNCIIIGCVDTNEDENLKNRIEETKSFCEITGAHSVLITEKEKDQKWESHASARMNYL
jgi:putative transcriptional regulator